MIPLSTPYLLAAVAVVAVLTGSAAGWAARSVVADRDVAELQASIAAERQRHADAARAAEAQARQVEQQRVEKIARIEHDAAKRTAALQDDARAARGAADSLRQHIARLAANSRVPSDTGPAGSSTPADSVSDLFAVVLDEVVQRSEELAAVADAARAAGLACQSAYEALR